MPSNRAYKAAAMFMLLLGSMVLGIAAGMGFVGYMVKQRLTCIAPMGGENACQDILEPAMDMIMAAGAGGFIAFVAGLLAIALIMQDEQQPEGDNE